VVVVVIVVHRENQAAIHRHARAQITANQVWWAQLSISHPDIGDQRTHSGAWNRPRVNTQTGAGRTVRANLANPCAGDDCAGGGNGDRLSGAHVDARIGAARVSGHLYCRLILSPPARTNSAAISLARANPALTIFSRIACCQTSFTLNLYAEGPAGVRKRAAICGQEQATTAFRSELAIAADFENRRARIIPDRSDQFAFSSRGQWRTRICRTK